MQSERDEKTGAGTVVLTYCRELFAESRIVNRCKLMFVGDGGVGKTSLVKSLKTVLGGEAKKLKKQTKKGGRLPSQEVNVATDGIVVNSVMVDPGKKLNTSKVPIFLSIVMWSFLTLSSLFHLR